MQIQIILIFSYVSTKLQRVVELMQEIYLPIIIDDNGNVHHTRIISREAETKD